MLRVSDARSREVAATSGESDAYAGLRGSVEMGRLSSGRPPVGPKMHLMRVSIRFCCLKGVWTPPRNGFQNDLALLLKGLALPLKDLALPQKDLALPQKDLALPRKDLAFAPERFGFASEGLGFAPERFGFAPERLCIAPERLSFA